MRHVVSQQRVLHQRLDDLEHVIKDTSPEIVSIKRDIRDMIVMMIPNSISVTVGPQRASGRGDIRSRGKNLTADAMLRSEVIAANPSGWPSATLLAELKIVFDTSIASESAVKDLADTVHKFHAGNDSVSMTRRCMNIFLYGFQRDMKKATFQEGIGLRHAEFRFKIVKIMLERSKALPEQIFCAQGIDEGRDGEHNGKPSWLTSSVVDKRALTHARIHQECLKSQYPKHPVTPGKKKALFIAKSYFKNAIDMLRYSRERCKVRMFEDGLFCLLKWEEFKWFPQNLRSPTFSFLYPEAIICFPDLIPDTTVGNLEDVAATNAELIQTLIDDRKEMLVELTYDVHIKKTLIVDGGKREEIQGTKHLRRVLNILRIAKTFLSGFCHWPEEEILRTHSSMLQCLYRFALVIREMFEAKLNSALDSTLFSNAIETRDNDPDRVDGRSTGIQELQERGADGSSVTNERGLNSGNEEGNEDEQPRRTGGLQRPRSGRHDEGRKTNPITFKGMLPAESEVERILHNQIEMSAETYKRLHTSDPDEVEIAITTRNNVENEDADIVDVSDDFDSDVDNMSDMMD